MYVYKRHFLTLIECIVGFALFALLATFLITTFSYSSRSKIFFETAANAVEKEQFFSLEMQKNLLHIAGSETAMHFVSKEDGKADLQIDLVRPLDYDPDFTADVTMTLSLKENSYLLQLQSKTKPSKIREITLLKPVEHIDYSFLYYTDKQEGRVLYTSAALEKTPYGIVITLDKNRSFTFYLPPDKVSKILEAAS